MSLTPEDARRYTRQILLAPIGGAGQQRLAAARVLLHGEAPLCRTYMERAGLGAVVTQGPADLVLDLGDGEAYRTAQGQKLWGAALGKRVLLGGQPTDGDVPDQAARALLETLAAGEALWRLLGHKPHSYDFLSGSDSY